VTADFDAVSLIDVSRHFGRRRAIARLSLTARAGDILGLLGPNGAGKSTLIGLLATLVAPTSGEVRFGDQPARALGAVLRRRLGLLAHELHLYPELSARQNLRFFGELYGVGAGRVEAALARAGLEERGDDDVSGFSRGMRQRLALERALLHDPKLILLDEPFTGLDQASTAALVERLRDRQRAGCVIVLATHDLDVAEGLLSRAIYLKDGRMVGSDSGSRNLADRYRSAIQS